MGRVKIKKIYKEKINCPLCVIAAEIISQKDPELAKKIYDSPCLQEECWGWMQDKEKKINACYLSLIFKK